MWARTGRELFYLDESNTLMAVPVQTSGPQFSSGRPAKVFDNEVLRQLLLVRGRPDGRRFLMMKESPAGGQKEPRSMVVVLNWFEEVGRRLPAR